MEYLRKVLFEYMMGRETKVCSSHEPTHAWPLVMQCFITMTDTKMIHKCVSRCISMTTFVDILCDFTRILYHPFRRLLKCNDIQKSISCMQNTH